MSLLDRLGWNARLEAAWSELNPTLCRARVAAEHRGRFEIWGVGEEPMDARLGGRLRHAAATRDALPVVGDWVAVRVMPGRAVIDRVLPRASLIARKAAGRTSERQPLAANVDVVLVVTAPGGDFSPRRIERYLIAAWDGGATPAIVLGKSDLCPDVAPFVAALAAVAPGVPVVAASALDGRGLDELRGLLGPGRTAVLLGSSGVGKSTLVNALAGAELQATASVRASDETGRHTTTGRQLFLLPDGGLILDTPGMRELGLAGDGLGETFADIDELAAACRFRDCRHDGEPGCAVAGAVDPERLAAYLALSAEDARQRMRRSDLIRIARDRRARARHDPKLQG